MPVSKLLSVTGWTGSGGSPSAPHVLWLGLANSASRTSEKREPAYARSSSVMPSIPNERGVTAAPSCRDQVALHVDGGVRLSRIGSRPASRRYLGRSQTIRESPFVSFGGHIV